MNAWDALYRVACVSLVLLFVGGLALVFFPAIRDYHDYQRRHAEALEQIRHYEERILELKAKQEKFHQDPRFVERLAHDLGMARPDEVIFRFNEEKESEPH